MAEKLEVNTAYRNTDGTYKSRNKKMLRNIQRYQFYVLHFEYVQHKMYYVIYNKCK